MNSADIFAPIVAYQMNHGRKTTSKQIALDTGMTEKGLDSYEKTQTGRQLQSLKH